MSIQRIAMISCLLLLQACAAKEQVNLTTTITEQEFAWSKQIGNNSVRGTAYEQGPNGEFHSCLGKGASIIPDTAYARERLSYLYGNLEKGYRAAANPEVAFAPDIDAYKKSWKGVPCNAGGEFVFTHLPDGKWYVITSIVWKETAEPDVLKGGYHMQAVTLSGGKTVNATFTK